MSLLFKSLIRSLLKNKIQAFTAALLLIFSGFFFSLMEHTLLPMSSMYDQAKTASAMEQFRFSPQPGTASGQLEALAREHRISYQEYRSKNISEPDAFFITTDYRGNIDRAIYTEGNGPDAEGNIAVSLGYARENKLHPGDRLTIQGSPYTISGIFYDLGDNRIADPAAPKARNAKIITTENAYRRLNGTEMTTYLGVFDDIPANLEEKIQQLSDDGRLASVTPSSSVSSASYLAPMLKTQTAVTCATIILMVIVSALFIAMFISTTITDSQARYGTALAMGYPKATLALPYLCMSLLFVLFTAAGTAAGFLGKDLAIRRMENINFPLGHSALQIAPLSGFTLTIALILSSFTLSQVGRSLNKKPLDLITGRKRQRRSKTVALLHGAVSRLPFKQHVKFAMALSHLGRFFLMIPAVTISVLLICWALSMNSAFGSGVKNLEAKTSYQKIVTYGATNTATTGHNHKFFRGTGFLRTIEGPGTGGSDISRSVTVEFLDLGNAPFALDAAPADEIIVPVRYHYLNGAEAGDTVTFKTPNGGTLSGKISSFSDLPGDAFYLPYALLPCYDDSLKPSSYNGEYLMAGDAEPAHYKNISDKQEITDKAKSNQRNSGLTVALILLFCVISAFAIISALSKNNASDNAAAMTIMLLSGYKKRTVSSLLLNIYNAALLIGIAAAIPLLPLILNSLAVAFSTPDGNFLPLYFSWAEIGAACASIALTYYLSLAFGTRKYLKMSLKEVLD